MLDEAVLSRVMLKLTYPNLDCTTRTNIWRTVFEVAGLRLQGCTFETLATLDLNGRQIRNLTRLTKILNPEGLITRAALSEA